MRLAVLMTTLSLSLLPAMAQTRLGEAQGNWAGASGTGFDFRAELTEEDGQARLKIWNAMPGAGFGPDPEFDKTGIVYRDQITAGGSQELVVQEKASSTRLMIVTQSKDETGDAKEVLSIAYLDNQFTVIGYEFHLTNTPEGADYSCVVDLRADTSVSGGKQTALAPRAFEADNLSSWGTDTAFALGYCPPA